MDGADTVIQEAAKHSWEAALLAMITIAGFLSFGWVLKRILAEAREREDQMAAHIDRIDAAAREDRMAARIDRIDAASSASEDYAQRVATLTQTVTSAIVTSSERHEQLEKAIAMLVGDVKTLCNLMRATPCLLTGTKRGAYRVTDADGKTLFDFQNGIEPQKD